MKQNNLEPPLNAKRAIGAEAFVFLAVFFGLFGGIAHVMGGVNMLNTMMSTAFSLLMNTSFFIMAVAVLAGAISALLAEFGVVALINRILSPLMKPLYGLPGAASVGIMATYLSDNPAILTLAHDKNVRRYFKKYQIPALTNIGTAFGMGVIVTTFMAGQRLPDGSGLALAALVGNVGAVIGSIVSTRLMIGKTAKIYGTEEPADPEVDGQTPVGQNYRIVRRGGIGMRVIDSMIDGGKTGVSLGLDIIPGILIICTLVMILTNGPGAGGVYTGAAYEGIGLLPMIGAKLEFILRPLFGFTSPEGIAVPLTALGSAGAAMGMVPQLLITGKAVGHDVAVFTAICMCWSGYLSTHVAMMSNLKCSELTGRAIVSHTIGGLCAGISANWIYQLIMMVR